MTAEQLRQAMRDIEAGRGIPKGVFQQGRQTGKSTIFEEIQREFRSRTNRNQDAYDCYWGAFGAADQQRAARMDAKREHKRRSPGKMEMLPFGCVQVREEVHLVGPGVHERAVSFSVASWAAARLNKQHCDGQRTFEITEIQATLIVGQRHLPNSQMRDG
jgi:hypothetical protein